MSLTTQIRDARKSRMAPSRKTILIYSPDLNFSFSLSMVFQDRYHVVTTSNSAMIDSFASTYAPDIAIIDAVPAEAIVHQIDQLKKLRPCITVIMTYVYDSRNVKLDSDVRSHVDAILYKPFEAESVLSEVQNLLHD